MAQDTIPFLKGKVNISISKGTIECDLTLSNIPRIEDYVIRLNSGMNIRYFKDPKKGYLLYLERDDRHDTTATGESRPYYFPRGKGGKYLPQEIQFRYLGMYPIFTDTVDLGTEDWRGNVAFTDNYLRVDGHQSNWYPVLYDLKRQTIYAKVKYDLDITCEDCKTLYVNGSTPLKAKSGNFKNSIPCEAALFCGNYDFTEIKNTYILNSRMTNKEKEDFANSVNSFRNYYQGKLNSPNSINKITFIDAAPVAKNYGFLFVAYPSIFNVGNENYSLQEILKTQQQFIAHELGHSYFSVYLNLNSAFKPIIDEGFTEYIALKSIQSLVEDSVYQKLLDRKIKALKYFTVVPFEKIKSIEIFNDKNFRELYAYYYAPIILIAIEKEVGEKMMWDWMKTMLNKKTDFTNYDFFIETLAIALKDDTKIEFIKTKYLNSSQSLQNAIETIKNQGH